MAILDVQHIEKHFGDTHVLEDISFSLEEGQALSIIGSSGSGKTTLLRCLNFLETPDRGVISVRGEKLFDADDPATRSESEIRKKRLHFGLVFQSFNLFPQYTALENVTLARGEDADIKGTKSIKERYVETDVDQALRQKMFEDFTTTDDHLEHITGIAKDQEGVKYYKTKNSWGTERGIYEGYHYMSENYVKGKTIAIILHKNAIPKEIKKKLGIK